LITSTADTVTLFVSLFAIFWFNLGGWLAIAPTSTLKLFGMWHYSQNYGVVFTAYGIGAIIGVLSSGLLLDLFGHYEYIFYYIIALAAIGLFLAQTFITPSKKA
jgi:MFS family permease